jgi:hypothetical protein
MQKKKARYMNQWNKSLRNKPTQLQPSESQKNWQKYILKTASSTNSAGKTGYPHVEVSN